MMERVRTAAGIFVLIVFLVLAYWWVQGAREADERRCREQGMTLQCFDDGQTGYCECR